MSLTKRISPILPVLQIVDHACTKAINSFACDGPQSSSSGLDLEEAMEHLLNILGLVRFAEERFKFVLCIFADIARKQIFFDLSFIGIFNRF